MKKLVMWGALLLVNAMAIEAAQACYVPHMPWIGDPVVGTITAQSGKRCAIYFYSAGPTLDTQITQRPKQGTLTIGEVRNMIYQSRPGFVGNDSFSYMRSGLDTRNIRIKRKFQITVVVTP